MYKLSSSMRIRTAEESLVLARQVARRMGVTRVTDITWLDKLVCLCMQELDLMLPVGR